MCAPNIPKQLKMFFDKLRCYFTPKYEVILGGGFDIGKEETLTDSIKTD